jgi:phage shock protein A
MDPTKEISLLIVQIEEGMKKVTADLVSYKASEKQMTAQHDALVAEGKNWEKRAMEAVRAGDDELAKKALAEFARVKTELGSLIRDRNEQAKIAADMLRSRRELSHKLESLKLRQGSIARNLELARTGGSGVVSTETEAFARFQRVEDRLEDDAAYAEVDAMDFDQKEAETSRRTKELGAEVELAALKAKMQQAKDKK